MAKLQLSLLLLFLLLHNANASAAATTTTTTQPSPTSFIVSSCKATRYPSLCIQSLSTYANTINHSGRQLAQTALSVSLTRAHSAAAFVANLSKDKGITSRGVEYQAVRDCIETMGDGVDRLSQSVKELGGLRRRTAGGDFLWRMSNVQTWVSAALTDENTCLDGLSDRRVDGRVKVMIRRRITVVAQVTSNALALVNRFAATNRNHVAEEDKP